MTIYDNQPYCYFFGSLLLIVCTSLYSSIFFVNFFMVFSLLTSPHFLVLLFSHKNLAQHNNKGLEELHQFFCRIFFSSVEEGRETRKMVAL